MSSVNHNSVCSGRSMLSDGKCDRCGKVPIAPQSSTNILEMMKDLRLRPEQTIKLWLENAMTTMDPFGVAAAMKAQRNLVMIAFDHWNLDHWGIAWFARLALRKFWNMADEHMKPEFYYHKLKEMFPEAGDFYDRPEVRAYISRQCQVTYTALYDYTWRNKPITQIPALAYQQSGA